MSEVHRQVCTAIAELRDTMVWFCETVDPAEFFEGEEAVHFQTCFNRRKAHMFSVIEEIQTHVNRMEAALYLGKDYFELKDELKELQEWVDSLKDVKEVWGEEWDELLDRMDEYEEEDEEDEG